MDANYSQGGKSAPNLYAYAILDSGDLVSDNFLHSVHYVLRFPSCLSICLLFYKMKKMSLRTSKGKLTFHLVLSGLPVILPRFCCPGSVSFTSVNFALIVDKRKQKSVGA